MVGDNWISVGVAVELEASEVGDEVGEEMRVGVLERVSGSNLSLGAGVGLVWVIIPTLVCSVLTD